MMRCSKNTKVTNKSLLRGVFGGEDELSLVEIESNSILNQVLANLESEKPLKLRVQREVRVGDVASVVEEFGQLDKLTTQIDEDT